KTENQKDFTTQGTANKILRIWTFADKNAYTIAYVAEEDKYDGYLTTAEKIIDSLKINTQKKSPQDYGQCVNNGNVAPCIGQQGSVEYYCDDPRSGQSGRAGECMPSP